MIAILAFVGAHKRLVGILGIALIAVALLAYVYAKGVSRERDRQEAAQAVAVAEALKLDGRAKEAAAGERLADAQQVATVKEELTDAVANLPDAVPSARRVALACERLRQQGADLSGVPACFRPGG